MKYLMILVSTGLLLGETFVCNSHEVISMHSEVHAEHDYRDDEGVHHYKVVIEIPLEYNEWLRDLYPPCHTSIMVYGDGFSNDRHIARDKAVIHPLSNATCLNVPYYDEYVVLSRYWEDPIWQLKQQHRRAK